MHSRHTCRALAVLTFIGAGLFAANFAQASTGTVLVGQSVTFSVSADDTAPFAYQWYKDDATIAGATGATYSIGSVQLTDAGNYYAFVSNSAGSTTSDDATLIVNAATVAPTFTTQPTSQTVTACAAVSFTAAAGGPPAPTYQWRKNGANLTGATSASYTIASVAMGDAGTYTVVATNSAGSVTSNGAVLTVNAAAVAPAFTTQPTSQTVTAGAAVTFTAAAGGTPAPAYQWQNNGANWAGATSASYTIASVAMSDAGTYTVVATNSAGSVTSNGAVLTVNAATVAPAFTTQPTSQTVTAGAAVSFTAAAGGTPAPAYQWQKNGANLTGATSASYTIASVATGDAGTYTVVATNSAGAVTSNGAVLTVNAAAVAPAFTTQPTSQTVTAGAAVSFTAAAGGAPAPTYQWQKNGANLTGATSASYTIASVAMGDAGTYTIVATNSAGAVTSNGAVLTVNAATVAPAFTTQPTSQTVTAGAAMSFTAAAGGTPAPTYQWRKNGANLTGATSASYTIASVAMGDAGTYTVVATNSAGAVTSNGAVLTVNAAAVAPAFTTQPTSQTVTAGAAVTFTAAAGGTPAPAYQWQKNGANLTEATGASYTIASVAMGDAGTYTVVATNSAGSVTSNGAVLTVNAATVAPAFTTQPTSQTVTAGAAVTFTAAAGGTPAPAYQSQKNITNLTGATSASYTIASVAMGDAGTYTVVATNSAGSVTSNGAVLTVNAAAVAPAFTTQPTSQTVTAGAAVTFTAAAGGTPAPAYQWQKNGANLIGATGASYTIASVVTGDAGTYTVVATNSAGTTTSNGAVLTVSIAPQDIAGSTLTADPAGAVIASGFIASWNAVTGATGYRLDVSTDSSFSSFVTGYQNLDVGAVTSMNVTGLKSATTYYYRVEAYDSAGTVISSSTITVATTAAIVITTPLTVSTLAGQALTYGSADGTGSGARFFYPSGTATDNAGNFYVADTDNHTIRKVVAATGAVTTLAGLAGVSGSADGTGSDARFQNPSGVAVDGAGNVYVADTLNHTRGRDLAEGVVSTLAGTPGSSGSTDGTGSAAQFQGPQGLTIDSAGNLYVADTNNHTIRKVVPATGEVTTIAGLAGNSGSTDGQGSAARFNYPSALTIDSAGNLYVADTDNDTIRAIQPSGLVSTLAGLAGNSGSADGTGSAARFDSPSAVAVDLSGNVYVADAGNFTIRKVVPATGAVSTLAGLAGTSGSTDGEGTAVRFFAPAGVAVDNSGNLYVADTNNDTLRAGLLPTAPSIQTQPQSQSVTAGSSAQFSVTASGRPAPTYQWYFKGTAISGAIASSYSLANAQSGNAGDYTVTVTNVMGSVTSNPATLTVNGVTSLSSSMSIGGGSDGNSGGGGGGAPSWWFVLALVLIGIVRSAVRKPGLSSPTR